MPSRITRRQLGLSAAAAAALANAQPKAEVVAQDSRLDPVGWTLETCQTAPLQLTFRATNKAEAEIWQRQLRAKLTELLGGFPNRTPLNAKTLEVRTFPAYRREKVIFESRPGVAVIAYLLTPSTKAAPYATVICVPGHGRGVEDIVGIDEHGNDRTDKPGYEHDFAIQVVEHGLAALAIEPMAFGYRRDARTRSKGITAMCVRTCRGIARC